MSNPLLEKLFLLCAELQFELLVFWVCARVAFWFRLVAYCIADSTDLSWGGQTTCAGTKLGTLFWAAWRWCGRTLKTKSVSILFDQACHPRFAPWLKFATLVTVLRYETLHHTQTCFGVLCTCSHKQEALDMICWMHSLLNPQLV